MAALATGDRLRALECPSAHRVRHLAAITVLLAGLTLLHDLDHLRQGRSLPVVLYLVAVTALASLAVTLAVLCRRPGWARPVAATQGVATVVGVAVVHAAPQWSSFSDSYSAAKADLLSWAIIIAMMLAGAALALGAAWLRPR